MGVRVARLHQLGCCKVIGATAEAAPPAEDQDGAGVAKAEADNDQRGLADRAVTTSAVHLTMGCLLLIG